jgi:hypothetical protein
MLQYVNSILAVIYLTKLQNLTICMLRNITIYDILNIRRFLNRNS